MDNDAPGQATLEDVAVLAGVSRSTASRVLTGSPHVSASAADAVRAAATALGYAPDLAARSLALRRAPRETSASG